MKRTLIYLAAAVAFAFIINANSFAQAPKPTPKKSKKARDLFVEREKDPAQGQPGIKVAIELNRGGKTSMVAPDYEFMSGDRIRLVLDINFQGYVALINEGTSGKKSLLYPYKGVSNEVFPNGALKIPNTDWIKFDDQAGTEKLVVIFSNKPIPELSQMEGTTGDGGGQTETTTGSTGGMATADEQAQILEELNSRSLKRGKALKNGRDLTIESGSDGTYAVAESSTLNDVIGFELLLKHN
jgi:hypothetical protein